MRLLRYWWRRLLGRPVCTGCDWFMRLPYEWKKTESDRPGYLRAEGVVSNGCPIHDGIWVLYSPTNGDGWPTVYKINSSEE